MLQESCVAHREKSKTEVYQPFRFRLFSSYWRLRCELDRE